MNKAEALKLCGGTVTATANALGVTHSAVSQWPDEGDIPESAENRVLAWLARKHLSPEVLGQAQPSAAPSADRRTHDPQPVMAPSLIGHGGDLDERTPSVGS
jgi:hypothetical protein